MAADCACPSPNRSFEKSWPQGWLGGRGVDDDQPAVGTEHSGGFVPELHVSYERRGKGENQGIEARREKRQRSGVAADEAIWIASSAQAMAGLPPEAWRQIAAVGTIAGFEQIQQ